MSTRKRHSHQTYPKARDQVKRQRSAPDTHQTASPSYRLAFADDDFLMRPDLRPVRLQLELLKPELIQQDLGINCTVVIFGGTRIPDPVVAERKLADARQAAAAKPDDAERARRLRVAERVHAKSGYYTEARKLASLISRESQSNGEQEFVVVTGGGPGIMEAANRGAADVGAKSIGLSIVLDHEELPNRYVTPELTFQFHYFAIRKMHFLLRAKALVAFPGGFGTLDELFETLTLIQTRKVTPVPVLLFGREYWERVIDFEALVEEGTIDPADTGLFEYVESADQAWDHLRAFWNLDSASAD